MNNVKKIKDYRVVQVKVPELYLVMQNLEAQLSYVEQEYGASHVAEILKALSKNKKRKAA